jgi:hypothetical protein
MSNAENNFAILVLSCDKYSDLWKPFLSQFKKHFPVGNYPIYFGSNSKKCEEPGVISLLSGDDPDWSTSTKRIVEQVKEPKLFVILEDLFLAENVDPAVFKASQDCFFGKDAMHIKYWASPIEILPDVNQYIGVYPKGAPFRATVCGFWDRKCLLALLIEGENPWNFEILGSYRTAYTGGFYGLTKPICRYLNMVEKGAWIAKSVESAQQLGIQFDVTKRPLLRGKKGLLSRLKMVYFEAMVKLVPWQWRVALMNKLRRALVSY